MKKLTAETTKTFTITFTCPEDRPMSTVTLEAILFDSKLEQHGISWEISEEKK